MHDLPRQNLSALFGEKEKQSLNDLDAAKRNREEAQEKFKEAEEAFKVAWGELHKATENQLKVADSNHELFGKRWNDIVDNKSSQELQEIKELGSAHQAAGDIVLRDDWAGTYDDAYKEAVAYRESLHDRRDRKLEDLKREAIGGKYWRELEKIRHELKESHRYIGDLEGMNKNYDCKYGY